MYLVMLRASAPRYCSRDARLLEVEIRLQAHPVARRVAEVLRETQRRVRRAAALAENDLVDAPRRHADMHPNLAKQRLKEGRLALGLGLRQARTVDIASAAATCGFDWLFIDMEHNAMSVDAAAQIAAAAPAMGVTPIVRVPGHEHYH